MRFIFLILVLIFSTNVFAQADDANEAKNNVKKIALEDALKNNNQLSNKNTLEEDNIKSEEIQDTKDLEDIERLKVAEQLDKLNPAIRIMFPENGVSISEAAVIALKDFFAARENKDNIKIRLHGFAAIEDSHDARHISVNRVYAVTKQLKENGLNKDNIEMRIFGNFTAIEPANRVDLFVIPAAVEGVEKQVDQKSGKQ